jgi:hypothetical protein
MWWCHDNFFWGGLVYHVAHSKAKAHTNSKWPKFAPNKHPKCPRIIIKSILYLQLIIFNNVGTSHLDFFACLKYI